MDTTLIPLSKQLGRENRKFQKRLLKCRKLSSKVHRALAIPIRRCRGRLSVSFTHRRKLEVSLNFTFTEFVLIFFSISDIVDKTASFVARNGYEFENRIHQSEMGNKKFSFLNPGDPYHAYYQFKVQEFKEGKNTAVPGMKNLSISSVQQKQQELLKQATEQFVPKDPPPEFEFIADPPSISALDLWVFSWCFRGNGHIL